MQLLIVAETSQMILDWINGLTEEEAGVWLQEIGVPTF